MIKERKETKMRARVMKKLTAVVATIGTVAFAPFGARSDTDWYAFGPSPLIIDEDGPGIVVAWEFDHHYSNGYSPYKETQFEIWRDGELIDVVSGVDKYRDIGTEAGSSYSYQIKALGKWSEKMNLRCYGSYPYQEIVDAALCCF